MKKKLLSKIAAAALSAVMCMSLAACQNVHPIDPSENGSNGPVENGSGAPVIDLTDKDVNSDPEAIHMLVDSFLNGGDKLYIETNNAIGLYSGDVYDINELQEAVNEYYGPDLYGDNPRTVDYIDLAYIDCGDDGIPEIALFLAITDEERQNEDDEILICKVMDGKLTAVEAYTFGYRSDGELNKYGVFWYYGSGGASQWVDEFSFTDANGENHFIYSLVSDFCLSEPMVDAYDMPSNGPSDYKFTDFDENGYTRFKYHFMPYPSDPNASTEEMDAYYLDAVYAFVDKDQKDATPSDELMKIYDDLGIKVTDTKGADAAVDDRLSELGITRDYIAMSEEKPENGVTWEVIYERTPMENQGGEN